jgi:hypothetical protein
MRQQRRRGGRSRCKAKETAAAVREERAWSARRKRTKIALTGDIDR